MLTTNITIKNVENETVEMLRDIRVYERRQLSVIFEDCVRAYYTLTYDDGDDCDARMDRVS